MNRDFPTHFGNGGHALGRKNSFAWKLKAVSNAKLEF